MKKVINGKSYNTEYDSEFVAVYTSVIDGWCRDKKYFYRKKSTGEYFMFSGKDSWHQGDIDLVSEKRMKDVLSHINKGENYMYTAMMAEFPGTKSRGYFWGSADDDPWDDEKVEKRKEEMKRQREETIRKAEEAARMKEESGEKTWGVMRVTGCSDGHKFGKIYGKEVPVEKKGVVRYHKVNLRIENNDKGNGWNCAYRYTAYVVLDVDDKKKAKEVMMETINKVVEEKGEFEPVMKGGHIVETEPKKNGEMWKEISGEIRKMNEAVIWG